MDELAYEALATYFNALEKTGYLSDKHAYNLLVLLFYKDFVFNDYRGLLSRDDYKLIEQALDCIYGNTCLISYPDYLKMGKLHLGEVTEFAYRLNAIENTQVIKEARSCEDIGTLDSDILIYKEIEERDNRGHRHDRYDDSSDEHPEYVHGRCPDKQP